MTLRPADRGKSTSPWFHAARESAGQRSPSGRGEGWSRASYITPEDITAARAAGADPVELAAEVLEAIGKKCVEDTSLAAHIAHEILRGRR